MSQKALAEFKCDYCGEKLVVPLDQGREQNPRLDGWLRVVRNDGSNFDYCRESCLVNGVKLMKPIERESPVAHIKRVAEMAPVEATSA
jgi:hypothetical protein